MLFTDYLLLVPAGIIALVALYLCVRLISTAVYKSKAEYIEGLKKKEKQQDG